MLRIVFAASMLTILVVFAAPARAADPAPARAADNGPGWMGVVVARGELKKEIDSTPILERPNRPFHFYGNTVRREYYRGSALPRPGDFVKGGAALVFKRRAGGEVRSPNPEARSQ